MTQQDARHLERTRRFLRNQTGIAAVEFALIVPVLLLAYLGATDLTQALAIDRKLSQVSATVSDLVAQQEMVDEKDDVEPFFDAGLAIMRPFEFDRTKILLTIAKVENGTAKVTGVASHNWGPIEVSNGDDYDLHNDEMLELAEGRYVVVARATYEYPLMFGTVFNNASMPLEQRSIHLVRRDVEEFGFGFEGTAAPEDADEDACAGRSGEQVQGANCENDNRSHDNNGNGLADDNEEDDRCFGYNCDRGHDDDDHRGGGRGGRGR